MVFYLRHRTSLVRNTGPVVGRYLLEHLGDCPAAEIYADGKAVD
jgi:hypothetical protein